MGIGLTGYSDKKRDTIDGSVKYLMTELFFPLEDCK